MAYSLYCIKGPFLGQEIPLSDVLIIGRDPAAVNLVIQDPAVSRAHLKLYQTAEGLVLEDLHSANGTFLHTVTGEQQAVSGAVLLQAGNRFVVGNTSQYVFEIRSDSVPPVANAPSFNEPHTMIAKSPPMDDFFKVDNSIFQTHTKIEITEDILATRVSRLCAYLIDHIIFLAVLWMSIIITGGAFVIASLFLMIIFGPIAILGNIAISYALYLSINGYFLNTTGQTIGKKIMRIYIADLNGRKAALPTIVGMRMLMMFVLSLIPLIGWLIALANILFIFRQDRRMIHDLLAGTVVLKCKETQP